MIRSTMEVKPAVVPQTIKQASKPQTSESNLAKESGSNKQLKAEDNRNKAKKVNDFAIAKENKEKDEEEVEAITLSPG